MGQKNGYLELCGHYVVLLHLQPNYNSHIWTF